LTENGVLKCGGWEYEKLVIEVYVWAQGAVEIVCREDWRGGGNNRCMSVLISTFHRKIKKNKSRSVIMTRDDS
jgi:hypothetical protein